MLVFLTSMLLAAAPQGDAPPAAATVQDSAKDPAKEREIAALDAYDALGKASQPPPDATPEQIADLAKALRPQLIGFAAQWPGTAAACRARVDAAGLDLHLLGHPDDGLALLSTVYEELKARQQPLPQRARLSAGRIGLQYADELIRNDRFDPAQKVLNEVVATTGPEKARAQGMLDTLPVLRKIAVGLPFPAFSAKDLDGKDASLADYQGKVLVIDFWATWCGPCKAEMPNVVSLYQKEHANGLEILGVSLDKQNAADTVRAFMKQQNMTWRQIYDGEGWEAAMARQYVVNSIPATFVLDRKGVIRFRDLRGAELARAVATLLAEP